MTEATELWSQPGFVDYLEDQWNGSDIEDLCARKIVQLITSNLDLRPFELPNSAVLDVGCGCGRLRSYFDNTVAYSGVDHSAEMVKRCNERYPGNASQASIYDLSEYSAPFVFSHAVLFHINDPAKAIKSLWQATEQRLVFSYYYQRIPLPDWLPLPYITNIKRTPVLCEDEKRGGQWWANNTSIPPWMLRRFVERELNPKPKRIYIEHLSGPIAKKHRAQIGFCVLDK